MREMTFKGIPTGIDLDSLTDSEGPTDRQIDLLHKWGYDSPETKEQATRIISSELEYRKNRGWREEEDFENADDVYTGED